MSASITWLSCGVLRAELEELKRLGKIRGELVFLDSMLHMNPIKLEAAMTAVLNQHNPEEKCLILVYGDCCPRMLNLVHQHRVSRVNAINCAQMLVGRIRYRELMREQAFMLLPEWAQRWKEVFQIELGLSKEVAHHLHARQSRTSCVSGHRPDSSAARDPHRMCSLHRAAFAHRAGTVRFIIRDAVGSPSGGIGLRARRKIIMKNHPSPDPVYLAAQLMSMEVISDLFTSTSLGQLPQKLTEQLREFTTAPALFFCLFIRRVQARMKSCMFVRPGAQRCFLPVNSIFFVQVALGKTYPTFQKICHPGIYCRSHCCGPE